MRPKARLTSRAIPRGEPGARPYNGSIKEVQGWVDEATFHAKYLYKEPVVFRQAATKENGFNLDCIA